MSTVREQLDAITREKMGYTIQLRKAKKARRIYEPKVVPALEQFIDRLQAAVDDCDARRKDLQEYAKLTKSMQRIIDSLAKDGVNLPPLP